IVLMGAAIFFLLTLESRIKRHRVLKALYELRSVSHVIDMHQLTKDPSRVVAASAHPTRSSPERTLTPFLLARYLDYCSEMLSLIGKLASLYAQSNPDEVVLQAVNDIETLTNGLSRKIWQKITMLDNCSAANKSTDRSEPAASSPFAGVTAGVEPRESAVSPDSVRMTISDDQSGSGGCCDAL
ncbi:MAG: hypothetical protein KDA85_21995, partial [Planctomycetaceae bacterium]|nr:hypothetical protein [Planctomycetaceae bacterium]